jgi:xanthine dehydrogenase accessory factor
MTQHATVADSEMLTVVRALCVVLVRGAGAVDSAVAVRLFRAGYAVLMHSEAVPTEPRRGMAVTDAVFDGEATLDGVAARRYDPHENVAAGLRVHAHIPVVAEVELAGVVTQLAPAVLVDARMKKRAVPEHQRGLALLTIGLGPNFIAGKTVDVAIETSWGERLGTAITRGATLPLAGEPQPIDGHARDRFVYAPSSGIFTTPYQIGDLVSAGAVIGAIGEITLVAPLSGALRGLTRNGVPVGVGTKVIEVDPRGVDAIVRGIGERPAAIAAGVVRVIQQWCVHHGKHEELV